MKHTYLLLLCGLLACQTSAVTKSDLTGHAYALSIDTTGIHELPPADQRLALAVAASKRTYVFGSDQKGTIRAENGPNDGEHPFEWRLANDSLHIVVVKLDGIQDKGYAIGREGNAIVMSRGRYKAWLRPL